MKLFPVLKKIIKNYDHQEYSVQKHRTNSNLEKVDEIESGYTSIFQAEVRLRPAFRHCGQH